jgi:Ca2+-binding EF-hand superfamily protein
MKSEGIELTEEEVECIMREPDIDEDGHFEEFVTMMTSK